MIPLTEALAAYAAHLSPLRTETRELTESLGHVLAEPVHSRIDLPRHSQSALDGYVMTEDDAARAPCSLRIVDAIAAGDTRQLQPLAAGECQRIFTGARVPPGAGAVVAQERVRVVDGQMQLDAPLKPGAPLQTNIRWQGEEVRAGAVLAEAGQTLTPALIASLTSGGAHTVPVRRQPRITLLVGGDELRPLGAELADGQIWDSNGPLVMAWLAQQGHTARMWRLGDDRTAVTEALREALSTSDLVLTTGGVSVGDHDHIIPAAESLGTQRVFWQVAQKPGKPLYFGLRPSSGATRHLLPEGEGNNGSPLPPSPFADKGEGLGVRGCALLGLPGNPAAVLIGLALHVRTVLNVLAGMPDPMPRWQHARLVAAVKSDAQRDCLLRMRLEHDAQGQALLHPLPHQDSHMMSNLRQSPVLVWVPAAPTAYLAHSLLKWIALP